MFLLEHTRDILIWLVSVEEICKFLQIETTFADVRDIDAKGGRVEKLISICEKVGADTYLSGPAAQNYIGNEFEKSGIDIQWMKYGPYPKYAQVTEEFHDHVSIIDVLANTGKDTKRFFSKNNYFKR